MSEPRLATISARIVDAKSNQEIATVERTLSISSNSEQELPIVKTLDEIVCEFLGKVEEKAKENNAKIIDAEKVYEDLVIGFAISLKVESVQPKIAIDIPAEVQSEGDQVEQ